MSIEAMKQALEALDSSETEPYSPQYEVEASAMRALRTAIQQAESGPADVTDNLIAVTAAKSGFSPMLVATDGGAFRRFAHAILALRPVQVPEGYALVPIEPTAEMLQAALKVATPGALRAAWARMLAASPVQKGDE